MKPGQRPLIKRTAVIGLLVSIGGLVAVIAWQAAGRERGEICWTRVWSFYAKVADARIGRWYLQLSRDGAE